MFLLLVTVVVLHQIYATLHGKQELWPLRPIYMRLIESVGRVVLIPFVLIYFVTEIEDSKTSTMNVLLMTAAVGFLLSIVVRECVGLRSVYYQSMKCLVEKFNQQDTSLSKISWLEVLMVNIRIFGYYSLSTDRIAQYFAEHREIIYDTVQGLRIKDLNMVHGVRGSTTRSPSLVGLRKSSVGSSQSPASEGAARARTTPQAPAMVELSPIHSSPAARKPSLSHDATGQTSLDSDDEV